MSIRKRYWFSPAEKEEAARELAREEGNEDNWEDFKKDAPAHLREQIKHGRNVGKSQWVVDYFDQDRKRRHKTFKTQKAAKAWAATTHSEVIDGTHVPDTESITVRQAGDLWLAECRTAGLEPLTIELYEAHLRLHILPFFGDKKLVNVSVGTVKEFQRWMRNTPTRQGRKRSDNTVRAVTGSLGMLFAEAIDHGKAKFNPARQMKRRRHSRGSDAKRHKRKIEIGVDIPTREDILAIIEHAPDRIFDDVPTDYYRVLLKMAAFTGLRASELRAVRWRDIDLEAKTVTVNQRADANRVIGSPKSESGYRTVPLLASLVDDLRHWRVQSPKRQDNTLNLVFPNTAGNVEYLGNIKKRGYHAAQLNAGLKLPVLNEEGVQKLDKSGRVIWRPKYPKFHALRHYFASWCINPKSVYGLQKPDKVVQEWLGHSSIAMTYDVYGHLFPATDDRVDLDEADEVMFGS